MKKSELKALIREVIEEINGTGNDFINHVKNKPFVVVVTDSETNKKREVGFDDHDAAMDFKLAAEEDGTYWGFHQNKDYIKDADKKTCTVCHGKGKTWTMCGDVDVDTTCNNCGGAGEV